LSYLIFQLGQVRYGLDTSRIVEVIPLLDFTPLSNVPEYIAGNFQYRGKTVTAVDLIKLVTGKTYRQSFSTRVIVINYPVKDGAASLLGLVVEHATDLDRAHSESIQTFEIEAVLPPAAMKELLR
jgi:chemotaxis-related protein WspB